MRSKFAAERGVRSYYILSHPREHPIFKNGNLLELIFQSPVWVIIYGTGLIFILNAFAWCVYGLGWYHHPKTYPMPHAILLDFWAETMRWIKFESSWSCKKKKYSLFTMGISSVILFPLIFIYYFKFLFGIWFGNDLVILWDVFSGIINS